MNVTGATPMINLVLAVFSFTGMIAADYYFTMCQKTEHTMLFYKRLRKNNDKQSKSFKINNDYKHGASLKQKPISKMCSHDKFIVGVASHLGS